MLVREKKQCTSKQARVQSDDPLYIINTESLWQRACG